MSARGAGAAASDAGGGVPAQRAQVNHATRWSVGMAARDARAEKAMLPERCTPSVIAHATNALSMPWTSFDAALIHGLTVISTS
jgi:hypothetical protein